MPSRAGLLFVETQDLRLIYYDPGEAHLVQHATQSFLSGLAAHKRMFDYVPDGRVSVLMQDFADRANASANATPRNRIFLDIAPWNEPYETVSPGDWFGWTALHELTHLAMNDRPSPIDTHYRRLFHGKVDIDAAHPETLLYNYLTVPRDTAPRWYQEGGAVFMETWLGGGVGRAQGGYDEMAFRAMVHDQAQFYDPLGLVSKGTEVDFKTGANAYLYGTRFMDYLALTYGPERLLDWLRRDADSRRYYADDFQRVFGLPLDTSWQQWIAWDRGFQQQNLRAANEHPLTAYHDLTHQDLGAISRIYASKDGARLYAAVKYPGQLAHLVAIDRRQGTVSSLNEVQGASGYTATSLAYDPDAETLFYTTKNNTHRNLEALDLRTGKSRKLLSGARIGDLVFNPTDRSLWGLRLNNGFVMLVRIPYPYEEWKTLYVFPSRETAFDLDLSPDGSYASMSVSGSWSEAQFSPGDRGPHLPNGGLQHCQTGAVALVQDGIGGAGGLRVLEGWPLSVRQQLLYGRVEYLSLRACERETRGCQQRGGWFLQAAPAGRIATHSPALHGQGVHAYLDRCAAYRGPERHHLSWGTSGGKIPADA